MNGELIIKAAWFDQVSNLIAANAALTAQLAEAKAKLDSAQKTIAALHPADKP